MTVLVLGGAGYVGSHAVDMLVNRGYDVAVVDNLVTGHREAVSEKVRFYEGDVRDHAFLASVFEKENIEGIMHFCAYSLVGESMQKPLMYFNNNVGGAQVILETMEEFGVKHIVFSSTAATFGIPEESPISEKTPQKPINPYGESKLIMEKMMKWQSQATDMTYVALRYFNVAGAKDDGSIGEAHKNETHLIIVGPNGQGKSSIIKYFSGNFSGERNGFVQLPQGIKISFVRQIYDNRGYLKDFATENQLDYELFLSNLRKLGMERKQFTQKIETMSQGQQKKVELARSLSQEAELYLWDEPLNYLDVFNHEQIVQLLENSQPTMLLVEHDQAFVEKVSNQIINLKDT